MTQPISVVVPVYDGVTQLDFTGPHQFLSRTPDLHVRVASLGGRTGHGGPPHLLEPGGPGAIESCDVLLVPGGGGCLAAIENDLFIKEIARLGATARYLTSVCTGIAHFGRCRLSHRPPCGLPLGMAGVASCLRRHRRRGPHREGRQYPVRGRRHGRHRFRAGPYRGAARAARGGNGSTRLGICASTALQLRAPGHGAGRSTGGGERAHGGEPRSTTCAPRRLGRRPLRWPAMPEVPSSP